MCSQAEQSKAREPRDNKRSTSPSIDFNQSAAKNVAVTDCDHRRANSLHSRLAARITRWSPTWRCNRLDLEPIQILRSPCRVPFSL